MALGPLMLSLPRLFLILGLVATFMATHAQRKRGGPDLEKPIWLILLTGLLSARIAYVLTHLPDFQAQPLQALYVWQDGYLPLAGVAAAAGLAAWFAFRGGYSPRTVFVPLVIGLLVWGGTNWVHQALRQAIDKPLPELTLEDLHSEAPVMLSSFRDQPVVLNLWATWCPPCRREMPVLEAAQQSHPGIHFLFVNQGEGPVTINQYLADEQLQLQNILLDMGAATSRHFTAPGLPTTLFFDADGQLVDSHVGELSRARLGDYLRIISSQEQ